MQLKEWHKNKKEVERAMVFDFLLITKRTRNNEHKKQKYKNEKLQLKAIKVNKEPKIKRREVNSLILLVCSDVYDFFLLKYSEYMYIYSIAKDMLTKQLLDSILSIIF